MKSSRLVQIQLAILLAIASSLTVQTVSAAPVTFIFEGEVDFLPVDLSTTVNIGDPFITTVTFESTTVDTAPGATGGEYPNAITSISSTIGSLSYAGGAGTINTVNNFAADAWKGFGQVSGPSVGGIQPHSIEVRMEDFNDLSIFLTDELPTFATLLDQMSSVRAQRLYLNSQVLGHQFRGTVTKVTDIVSLEPSIPGGGGTLFDLQAVDILGEGASSNGLQSLHGLDAQSVAGSAAVDPENEVKKSFVFEREDGGSAPQLVYLGGNLDGLLAADNGGFASVEANLILTDAGGSVIDTANYMRDVNPGVGIQSEVLVHEILGMEVELTPGETYVLISQLKLEASSPLAGAGRALFSNTFDVRISGEPIFAIPEPATLWLAGIGLGVLIAIRKLAD